MLHDNLIYFKADAETIKIIEQTLIQMPSKVKFVVELAKVFEIKTRGQVVYTVIREWKVNFFKKEVLNKMHIRGSKNDNISLAFADDMIILSKKNIATNRRRSRKSSTSDCLEKNKLKTTNSYLQT